MIRSQLEYTVSVWNPYRKEDILGMEKVQMRATNIVSLVLLLPKDLNYQCLNLEELESM